MFSVRNLFGDGNKIYTLLTASAEEGIHSVETLTRMLADGAVLPSLEELALSHEKDKTLHVEIRQSLATTHSGEFDRHEIEALANALYRVPKSIEKFAERYVLSASHLRSVNFGRQLQLLDEAIQLVVLMLKDLSKRKFATVNEQNTQLQTVEGKADKLMLQQIGELYDGRFEVMAAIALRDLYDILEDSIDHCRDAGQLVSQLVLKHS